MPKNVRHEKIILRRISEEDLNIFREDYRELEKDIQNFFRVYYLSGLIVVAAWIVGPQSKPLVELALGNGGKNIYAPLAIAFLNLVSTTFIIYKSSSIHEIAQFIVLLGKANSVFDYWENWRRSPYSITNPIRFLYAPLLMVVPFLLSAIILWGTGRILFSSPFELIEQIRKLQPPTISFATFNPRTPDELERQQEAENKAYQERTEYAQSIVPVFNTAKWIWALIIVFHLFIIYHTVKNTILTNQRWKRIEKVRKWDLVLRGLDSLATDDLETAEVENQDKVS